MRAKKSLRIGAAAATVAMSMQLFGSLASSPGADAHSGVVSATTRVHVRTQPTTSSTSLAILSPGQKVSAAGTTNGWTKITWNGRTAYVYAQYLSSSVDAAPVVDGTAGKAATTANLNVRTGPTLQHRVIAVASKGSTLTLTGRSSGTYTQITWNSQQAWVASRYLNVGGSSTGSTPSASTSMQTRENLNIRTGASTAHRSVAVAPKGTILPATGRASNGFNEVVWQGTARWAASSYLVTVSGSPTTPTPTIPTTTKRWATTALNIWYESTGTRYNGELPKGSVLNATGKIENGRMQIVHNGALRWVTARYTTATDPTVGDNVDSTPGNWDLTSPPITGGLRGTALNKGWSSGLERTNPRVQRIAADVWERFPEIKTQYGWRRDVTPDHPAGRAVDVMIPNYRSNKTLGWAIANYYRKHAKTLGINYIIFDQKIWSVARNSEGWRSMASRGNDTANHLDHVHINTYG